MPGELCAAKVANVVSANEKGQSIGYRSDVVLLRCIELLIDQRRLTHLVA